MLRFCYDVAFTRNVEIIEKISYNSTIDVKFGIYKGMLSINLAPSPLTASEIKNLFSSISKDKAVGWN